MPINPYLNFPGTCREVIEYYAGVFHTEKPQIMTFAEMPADPAHPLPDGVKDRVLHGRIVIAGTAVMFSDTFPGMPFTAGNNITLAIVTTSREDVSNWFDKLKEGGSVGMDLQETFWSKLYGNLTDKYGIGWQLSLDSGETFDPAQGRV
jgi:PhnB protein